MPDLVVLILVSYLASYLFAIALLLLVLFQASRSEYGPDKFGRMLFTLLILSLIFAMTFDGLAWLPDNLNFEGAELLSPLLTFLSFGIIPLPFMAWLMYSDYKLFGDKERLKKRAPLYSGLFLINIVLLVINIWTGWYFSFTESGQYIRGPLMPLSYMFAFAYLLWAAYEAFSKMRHSTDSKETQQLCKNLLLFIVAPVVGGALQLAFYGLSAGWIATTFSVILYYINDQLFQLRKIQRLENEVMQSKVSVMLSQIQPHFLYNSLVVIKQLCDIDPAKAKEATVEFSHYLRANLDSLTTEENIPFEKELEHIENYLALEQKRFGDRVNVFYDIEDSDFLIPALTVQPLVENAVRYGIVRKEEGGTVEIRVRRQKDEISIEVIDNGVGFEVNQPSNNDRSHVGIENTRKRLETLCSGSLKIESAANKGTRAVIHLPQSPQREVNS